MAKTYLLEASPRNKTSAATVAVRIAGGGSRAYNHKGFNDWRSGLASRPLFSSAIEFDQNGFSGGAIPNVAALEIRASDAAWLEFLSDGVHWKDADFTLSSGDDANPAPTWAVEMSGKVQDIRRANGAITLTVIDRSGDTDIAILNRRFAGTGTIEGDAAAAGRICRRSWGLCFNVEGFPLVAASNIYEFGDLTKPINAINNVRDKGRGASGYVDIAWQGTVAATYAALAASSPPQGGVARAPSIACVKWWTEPVGPLTADISGEVGAGYIEYPVEIATRIVAARTTLGFSNASAANALRPVSAGLHVDNEGETVGQALDRLLRGVSLVWVVQPSGQIFINEIAFSSPVETVRVHEVERVRAYKPVRLRKLGYKRNHRIHGAAEISAALLDDNGDPVVAGLDGADGAPGAPGADGVTLYEWIAYADSIDGAANFITGAPSGRVYIGRAINKTTPVESTNPADYEWALYRGPATFGLVNFNANSIVGPNFVQKVGGGAGWDASVYSSENFRGACATSFTVPNNTYGVMAGINQDPTTDANFASLDAAFYVEGGTGTIYIYESGNSFATGWTNTPGTVFQIIYDGKTITYSYGTTSLSRVISVAPDLRFYFDSSLATGSGARIENITWAAAGKAGSDGTDGIPGADNFSWIVYADHPAGALNFTTGAPGGRAFIGRADNKTSPTESTDPADYVWSPYTGPPNFGLVAGENMTVAGARLLKSGGAYAWDAQVYSSESYKGGAFLSWRPEIKDQMILGLNTDPVTNASHETIDVAIYLSSTGWDCRINSVVVYTHPSDWALGDSFAVHYTGSQYLFLKNGVIHHTEPAGAGFSYWFDSSFTQQGLNATLISWAAAGATGAQGDPGADGADGANGAQGPKGDPLFGFVQDGNPGNGEFIRQTWYRPTSKELYLWDGDSWERMLGELSAKNVISESAFIGDLVVVNGHFQNLTIGTGKIANNQITVPIVLRSGLSRQGNSTYLSIASGGLSVDHAATLTVQFSASHTYTATVPPPGFEMRILVNGAVIQSVGGDALEICPTLTTALAVAAGAHTVEVQWKGKTADINIVGDTTLAMGIMK